MSKVHDKVLAGFAKRRQRAVRLWDGGKGLTQQEIANSMSVSRQAVCAWIKREMKKAG